LSLNLNREAVRITAELGSVVFVGAFAVNHFCSYRSTRDIDLVLASPLKEQRLVKLGYQKWPESRGVSWRTPRGIKVDFYTKDVGRIPVAWILKNAEAVEINGNPIKIICLEGLIITKHRAGRTSDIDDLRHLLAQCGDQIKWEVMQEIATDVEIAELRKISKILAG